MRDEACAFVNLEEIHYKDMLLDNCYCSNSHFYHTLKTVVKTVGDPIVTFSALRINILALES